MSTKSEEDPAKMAPDTEGSQEAKNTTVLAELARLVASGELDVPIAATYPLSDVRTAFAELELGHTRGKIVLLP